MSLYPVATGPGTDLIPKNWTRSRSLWLSVGKRVSYNRSLSTQQSFQSRVNAESTMPIYEFRCTKCNAYTEVFQKLSDKQPTRCRKCKGRLKKLDSKPAIQCKGEHWYVTDYARQGSVADQHETELATTDPSLR